MNTQHINSLIQRATWFNRISLFVVYFWFGFLKIIGTSPAEGLVAKLFDETLAGFMPIEVFLPAFGVFECALGLFWLSPRLTRIAFWGMCFHMFSTFLPMALLEGDTWQSFMTLTLTGQYIVKNLVLIGASWFVYQLYYQTNPEPESTQELESERQYANA
ncbi:hypothetical protein [Jiulongibacter sediminis]|uniref:DoxX family protein n=1 Tax=Jiulongibacter sediminis TaxID=1605367 RepID=A0A0P7BES2_9BACT|nr:hypothetical protein [Jiulongibacter sediminis]KPM49289.1 hypothetical protein AFM12_01290 [Jiulongibacter sediminis]